MATIPNYLKTIFFILVLLQIAPPLLRNIIKQYSIFLEPHTKVAHIPIKGVILNSSYYIHHLKTFFKDESIKAILLTIDSPGSAAGTAEAISHEIELLKKEFPKPIISLSENICASGAYYIASTTDWIIASPSTIVGSIGSTIPYQFKIDKLLQKYDVTYIPVTAGAYKNALDPFTQGTQEQQAMLQELTNDSYKNFVEHVARHRTKADMAKAADGKLWSGTKALELTLIDEIGSQSTAIKKLKKMTIIEGEIAWIKPIKSQGIWSTLWPQESEENNELQSSSFLDSCINHIITILQQRYAQ